MLGVSFRLFSNHAHIDFLHDSFPSQNLKASNDLDGNSIGDARISNKDHEDGESDRLSIR